MRIIYYTSSALQNKPQTQPSTEGSALFFYDAHAELFYGI